LVVVTSDHGENLGEGQLIGHAFSLDDRLIRVPLVLAGPGAPAGAALGTGNGPGLVSLVDLPRLLAEATGLDDHPWGDRVGGHDGVAVAQLDPLAPPDDPRLRKAADDWDVGDEGVRRMSSALTCATDGRLKLLRRGDEDVLYDLAADPFELVPRPADGSVPAGLRHALDEAAGEPVAGPTPPPAPPEPGDDAERADLERRMRLMGYL
jgi:arylsulfatase A-like enzyme